MSSAQASYKLLQAIDPDAEIIGPIQMGAEQAYPLYRLRELCTRHREHHSRGCH